LSQLLLFYSVEIDVDLVLVILQEKKDDSGEEPTPKRPRGRPPKNPKPVAAPVEAAVTSDSGDASAKKKRGRPPKKTTA